MTKDSERRRTEHSHHLLCSGRCHHRQNLLTRKLDTFKHDVCKYNTAATFQFSSFVIQLQPMGLG